MMDNRKTVIDFNNCSFVGRLTNDSKVLNGKATGVCFSIANNTMSKTLYLKCVAFGDRFSKLTSYLVKGKQVSVGGRLEPTSREVDGVVENGIQLNVRELQLLGGNAEKSAPRASVDDFEDDVPF